MTPKTDEVLHRTIDINRKLIDEEARTVQVIVSTEAPVDRYFGVEVLDHRSGSVDLGRMNNSAALLSNHDSSRQIGVIVPGSARIEGGKLKATVKFSRSEDGEREFQDVIDGIRTKLSVGYRIHDMEPDGEDARGIEVYRVTRWEPYEASMVAIPADVGAQVGRSQDGSNTNTNHQAQAMKAEEKPKAGEGQRKADPPKAPEPKAPDNKDEVRRQVAEELRIETERRDAITSVGETYGFEDEAKAAIRAGTQLEDFVKEVRSTIAKRVKENPLDIIPGARGNDYSRTEEKDFSGFRYLEFFRQQHSGKGLSGLYREAAQEFQREAERWGVGGDIGIPTRILNYGRRDATATGGTGGSQGGATVATELRNVIDVFNSRLVLNQLGVTMLTDLQGNVEFPKPTKGSDPTEKAENASADEYDATWGKVSMTPKRLPAFTQISTQLMRQQSVDVENWIRRQIGIQLAVRMQDKVINGTGSSSEPLGLLQTTGIGGVTTSGTLTWALIVEFESDIDTADALEGSLNWLTTPAVRAEAKTTEKASNTAVFLSDGQTMNGYPLITSTTVPANHLIFGNWSDLYVGMWGGLSTTVDPYTNSRTGLVNITFETFYDSAVARAASFSVATDVTP